MADQGDVLVDMPLLESVVEDSGDEDVLHKDEVDKGSGVKRSKEELENERSEERGDSKSSLCPDSIACCKKSTSDAKEEEVEGELVTIEETDNQPDAINEPQSNESSSGDSSSSNSNNDNNSNINHSNNNTNTTIKNETCSRPSSSSVETAEAITACADNHSTNITSTRANDSGNEVTSNNTNSETSRDSISSSSDTPQATTNTATTTTQTLTNQEQDIIQKEEENKEQKFVDSVDDVDSSRADTCSINSGNSTASATTSSLTLADGGESERSGSSSNRLLSSDSDFGQDSIVTVEVIAIPRSVAGNGSGIAQQGENSGVSLSNENDPITRGNEQEAASSSVAEVEEREGEEVKKEEEEEEEEEVVSSVETQVVEMSDQQRLEEKLRQFENDAKEREQQKDKSTEDTGQMSESESEKQRRRNLIFDEERFEETFLKCLICREVYNETDKLPKMLHCHHTFCMDCLYQMYRVEGEFRQSLTSVFRNMPLTVKIQCPTCREGIIISEAELRRLPNDHTIMELLCFVNKTGKNDVQYCPKHQMQPLNFFCEPCIMPVCCDCTVLDHKESKGHRVVNVDEAMKKYTPIVEDTLNDIRKEKSTLSTKKESLENTQEDLNRIQSGISDQIRKVFDTIREVLDERERELHDVAVSEVDRKQGIIEGHLNTIADREADLNTEFNALQLATDDKDISLIFTGHKSARDLLARKVFIPTNSTAGFSITFQFSSRADTVIKQQVANLGDVIFHS